MIREYPEAPIVAVGVVVKRGHEVLLVQRLNEPSRGRWSLPVGAMELGETVREAARREVREECGLQVEPGEVLAVVDNIVPDQAGRVRFHYVLIDLLAEYVGGELAAASDIGLGHRRCPLGEGRGTRRARRDREGQPACAAGAQTAGR